MADNYNVEKVPFEDGDLLELSYDYGFPNGGKALNFNRTIYLKVKAPTTSTLEDEKKRPTIDQFITQFNQSFLTEGFTRIQSTNVRWNSLKITVLQSKNGRKIAYLKPLKAVYGVAPGYSNSTHGFLFSLTPLLEGPASRFYVRGVVQDIAFFDQPDNKSGLLEHVTKIEELFIKPFVLTGSNMSFIPQINVPKQSANFLGDLNYNGPKRQVSAITAAYGKKLYKFKDKTVNK